MTHPLQTLHDKVEAGNWDWRLDWPDWDSTQMPPINLCYRSFDGDLNAAKALHDAVLPGWAWSVKTLATDSVQVWVDYAYGLRRPGFIGTTKDNPSRAWLLAVLRALINEGE